MSKPTALHTEGTAQVSGWLNISDTAKSSSRPGGGREALFARGGIREHDAFLSHEMRGPAGTGRGGVSMAGGQEGQGARKRNGVRGHRLPSPPCFAQNLLMYFGFLSR